MLDIVKSSSNGNGLNSINGRGLARRHLTVNQRIDLAADLACGQQHLHPSIRHVAALLKVLPSQVSERLKARAQPEAKWQAAEARWRSQEEAEAANTLATGIVVAWNAATPEARAAAVRTIGVSHVWDVVAQVVV